MGRLDGKVAIITGGGSGMGRATAVLFAKEGAKVTVADWAIEGGEATVETIKEAGGEAVFVKTDVSKAEDVKKMIKTAIGTYGKLDILYNNAAIAILDPLIDVSEETFDKIISVNLKGVWLGMKYAIPEMIRGGGGSIINVSSQNADRGQRGLSIYSASKGGLTSMSITAAVEYGDRNIRVNVIKPGVIMTPMAKKQMDEEPEIFERVVRELTPQHRLGEPEEVAAVALFFASDESSHVTGQKLTVDGGIEAWGHIM